MNNSNNQKLTKYFINVEFLVSSSEIINGNLLNIPITINKSQAGSENLYVGKKLNIFIYDKVITGTYQQKTNNTEYLRITNITELTSKQIEFNINSLFQYIEVPANLNDTIALTINDVKRIFKTTKNTSEFKGTTGLLEPLQLEALESIKFIREVSQKTISELIAYTTTIYYEVDANENNTQIQFGLFHSLFNVEFELKIFGSNYTMKMNRYGASELVNNINFGITINKIPNNDSTKNLYQILFKLINVPIAIQSNVEKIRCYINESLTKQTVYSVLPSTYTLTNSTLYINDKIYSRFILFYDNNGVVSLNPNESIKLLGSQNLNNITNVGWYHYDVFNVSDILLNNLPANNKGVFYINVKRLTNDLLIQYLYVYDSTLTVVKTFSRVRNNVTLLFTAWIEYVTSSHKHKAVDIIEDETHKFVTQEQINTWNNYAVSLSDYWNNAVQTTSELISPALNGESRLVLSTMKIYSYVAANNTWIPITDSKLTLAITSDSIKLIINEGGTNREVVIPEVSDNNPGIVPVDFFSTDYKNELESKLNFTNQNAGTDIPGFYSKQLHYPFNMITAINHKIVDGIENYLINLVGDIDLTSLDNIERSLFTKYDEQNIYANMVTEYQFILIPKASGNNKIKFPVNHVINVYEPDLTLTVSPTTDYILAPKFASKFLVKIKNNIVNIYRLQLLDQNLTT